MRYELPVRLKGGGIVLLACWNTGGPGGAVNGTLPGGQFVFDNMFILGQQDRLLGLEILIFCIYLGWLKELLCNGLG